MLRRTTGIGLVALAVTALAGCASEPEPEPTWTEEEAYAAAEETYREYWLTVNDDSADPLELLTPEMTETHLDGDKKLEELGVEIRGETVINTFEITEFRVVDEHAVVSAKSCVDGSEVEVQTDGGEWKQPRKDSTYGIEIDFESVDSAMLIASVDESEDLEC